MSVPYHLRKSVEAALRKDVQTELGRLAKGKWQGEVGAREIIGRIRGLEQAQRRLLEEYGKIEKLEGDDGDSVYE